jgi:hypothetical protein
VKVWQLVLLVVVIAGLTPQRWRLYVFSSVLVLAFVVGL